MSISSDEVNFLVYRYLQESGEYFCKVIGLKFFYYSRNNFFMHLKFVPVQTVKLCLFLDVWTARFKAVFAAWFNSLTLSNMLGSSQANITSSLSFNVQRSFLITKVL